MTRETTNNTPFKVTAADRELRRYRKWFRSLNEEEQENERYTVEHEWHFAADDYERRYPHLERDDLMSVLRA